MEMSLYFDAQTNSSGITFRKDNGQFDVRMPSVDTANSVYNELLEMSEVEIQDITWTVLFRAIKKVQAALK